MGQCLQVILTYFSGRSLDPLVDVSLAAQPITPFVYWSDIETTEQDCMEEEFHIR